MVREALFIIIIGFSLITLILAGVPLSQWVWLTLSGYQPSDWNWATVYVFYLIIGVALYLLFFAYLFRLFFVRRGADGKNTVQFGKDLSSFGITTSVITIALAYGGFHLFVFMPLAAKLLHSYHDWPAALRLEDFEVRALEVQPDWETDSETARGRIIFELANQSSAALREATFTVVAGRFWGVARVHRFQIRDLLPQQKRRVEIEAELGRITRQSETSLYPTRLSARIYYGRVQFEGSPPVILTRRPVNSVVAIK